MKLTPGTLVDVEIEDDNLSLRPAEVEGKLVLQDGILIYDGGGEVADIDVDKFIQEGRQERVRVNMGQDESP